MANHDAGAELNRLASLDSMEGITRAEPSVAPSVFSYLPRGALLHAIYPGVLVAVTIGLAAAFLSEHYARRLCCSLY